MLLPQEEHGMYYDRQGNDVGLRGWMRLTSGGFDYRRVAEDTVGEHFISTVWLGLNHNFRGDGPPLIFETMVFLASDDPGLGADFDFCRRYATEAEALAGHHEAVTVIRATLLDLPSDQEESTHGPA